MIPWVDSRQGLIVGLIVGLIPSRARILPIATTIVPTGYIIGVPMDNFLHMVIKMQTVLVEEPIPKRHGPVVFLVR